MSDAGGAAYNPMVRTCDHVPAEPEPDDRAQERRDDDQADDGQLSGEDDE
jgi:hypothetical protein